jgi:hypothetical protein
MGTKTKSQDTLVLLVTRTLHARMKQHQHNTGTPYREQVLDALEATHHDLPDLIGKTTPPVVQGSLFERVLPATAPAEARVQVTIRNFLPTQMAVIDHLVDQVGATGRVELVATALDHHLPEHQLPT